MNTYALLGSFVYFVYPGLFSKLLPIICFLLEIVLLQQQLGHHSNKTRSKYASLIFYGLLWSLFGDIALELDDSNDNYFIAGLIFFLVAHTFYIRAFYHNNLFIGKSAAISAAICTIYYFYMMAVLIPSAQLIMRIPIAIYGSVIAVMVHCAITYNFQKVSAEGTRFFGMAGAIAFAISDTILAVNKFHYQIRSAKLWIMITYYFAQALITSSTS